VVNVTRRSGLAEPVPPEEAPRIPALTVEVGRRLLDARIVMLSGAVDDEMTQRICGQLLALEAEDPERDVTLFINSPGGSVDSGFAIYDTMRFLTCDVSTVVAGLAASMGQFLLCAGAPGKRFALRHSQILMHQPHGQLRGVSSDIVLHARQFAHLRTLMAERIAAHTGQTKERVLDDFDRDHWFTAEEALAYGMVDAVVDHRSQLPHSEHGGAS
jgi:ATP-dependent Clp protease protease subunit